MNEKQITDKLKKIKSLFPNTALHIGLVITKKGSARIDTIGKIYNVEEAQHPDLDLDSKKDLKKIKERLDYLT